MGFLLFSLVTYSSLAFHSLSLLKVISLDGYDKGLSDFSIHANKDDERGGKWRECSSNDWEIIYEDTGEYLSSPSCADSTTLTQFTTTTPTVDVVMAIDKSRGQLHIPPTPVPVPTSAEVRALCGYPRSAAAGLSGGGAEGAGGGGRGRGVCRYGGAAWSRGAGS